MTSNVSLESCRHVSEEGYPPPLFKQVSLLAGIVWLVHCLVHDGETWWKTLALDFLFLGVGVGGGGGGGIPCGQAEHTWTAANSGLREKQSRVW